LISPGHAALLAIKFRQNPVEKSFTDRMEDIGRHHQAAILPNAPSHRCQQRRKKSFVREIGIHH